MLNRRITQTHSLPINVVLVIFPPNPPLPQLFNLYFPLGIKEDFGKKNYDYVIFYVLQLFIGYIFSYVLGNRIGLLLHTYVLCTTIHYKRCTWL